MLIFGAGNMVSKWYDTAALRTIYRTTRLSPSLAYARPTTDPCPHGSTVDPPFVYIDFDFLCFFPYWIWLGVGSSEQRSIWEAFID